MGVCGALWRLSKAILLLSMAFLLLLWLSPDPEGVEFESIDLRQRVPFEHGLAVNDDLDAAQLADPTVEGARFGKIEGPESYAVRDNYLYTGIHGGDIIRLNLKRPNDPWESVFQLGQPCQGQQEEGKCGRALGMAFDRAGQLIVCDISHGLVRVDLKKKTSQMLVPNTLLIEGKPSKIVNSVAVAKDGNIYFTVSSTRFQLQESVLEVFSKGSGRLLKYDPKTNSSQVLLEGLNFANGLTLGGSKDDHLFVSDLGRARIWKYHLTGPKAGQSEIFVARTPGFADNLVSNGRGGFYAGLIAIHHPGHFDPVIDVIFPSKQLCRLVVQLIHKLKMVFDLADKYVVSHPLFRKMSYWIGNTQASAKLLAHPYGLVVEYDSKGNVARSWHSPSGKVRFAAEGFVHQGIMYIGSPYNDYLAMLKLKNGAKA